MLVFTLMGLQIAEIGIELELPRPKDKQRSVKDLCIYFWNVCEVISSLYLRNVRVMLACRE